MNQVLEKQIDRDRSGQRIHPPTTFLDEAVKRGIEEAVEQGVRLVLLEHKDRVVDAVRVKMEPALEEFATEVISSFTKQDWRASLSVKLNSRDV